jgi:hypothetical protein
LDDIRASFLPDEATVLEVTFVARESVGVVVESDETCEHIAAFN